MWKIIYAKKAKILVKLKLWQIAVVSEQYIKIHNSNKIPYKYLVNPILELKKTLAFHFPENLHKKMWKSDQKLV